MGLQHCLLIFEQAAESPYFSSFVKAKKCVPAARHTIGEGVVRSTTKHCGCISPEQTQTLPALARVKMEVADMTLSMSLESATLG